MMNCADFVLIHCFCTDSFIVADVLFLLPTNKVRQGREMIVYHSSVLKFILEPRL